MKKIKLVILIMMLFLFAGNANAISAGEDVFGEDNLFAPPSMFREKPKESSYEFRDADDDYTPLDESVLRSTSTTPPLKKLRLKIAKYKNKKQNDSKNKEEVIEEDSAENSGSGAAVTNSDEDQQNIIISSDDIFYSHENSVVNASGSVVVDFQEQGAKLYADEINFYNNENILIASGNVRVVKDGMEVSGDYIKVDLNVENIIVDKPYTRFFKVAMTAKNSCFIGRDLIQEDGKLEIVDDLDVSIYPQSKLRDLRTMLVNEAHKSSVVGKIQNNDLKIQVGKLTLDSKKDNNILYLQDAEFFIKGKKVLKIPHVRFCTNKNIDYIEGNYPEIGSIQDIGTYAGPGWAFDLPKGATLKVAPLFVVKSRVGFGGLAKLKNGTNETELYYGTSESLWVLRGKQKLDDHLYLQYGVNDYMYDWFLGRNKSRFAINLVYGKSYQSDNFLNKNLYAKMTTRTDLGVFKDAAKDKYFEKLHGNNITTFRARTMLEGVVGLYSYRNEEKESFVNFDLVSRGSAAIYGTGDTQFVGRLGPRLRTQYKWWMQDVGYFHSVYSDNTPMPVFDKYRYGKSNVYAREYIRLCRYLTLILLGSYNITDDYYGKKRFSECGVYASIGPDDLKLDIGYDFIREMAYVNVHTALNAKGAKVGYDKLVIKNIDNCKTNTDEDNAFESAKTETKAGKDKLLKYAVTEDINEYANEL